MDATIIRQLDELRAKLRDWKARGEIVGVVPTMGALHEGHLNLVRAAKASCDRVIVTLFVNPRQFNSPEDFAKYPRTELSDAKLLGPFDIDVLFVPDGEEVYPANHATAISVSGISEPLEGAHRPGHFDGVATVVTILFNMTQADRAFFGEKDWQQLQVVRRLVADLRLPVEIVPCPTVRAEDGLALSSRNQRLSPDGRKRATAIPDALETAARALAQGRPLEHVLDQARSELASRGIGPVEYLELCDAETLGTPRTGHAMRLLIAAWLDGVRLIDNIAVDPVDPVVVA